MATSIPQTDTPPGDATPPVPAADRLGFLDARHPIHVAFDAAWAREERRFEGGDDVLAELFQFEGESAESYAQRTTTATYRNFARAYTSATVGALSMVRPTPNYGTLGEVRARNEIDVPTVAELVHYNADGIGNDGQEFPAFMDGVDERALSTGHRWLLEEMPALADVRASMRARGIPTPGDRVSPTMLDVLNGFRSYLVEFSPRDVTNWYARNGVLQFAVVRVPVGEPTYDASGAASDPTQSLGYYLLVRAGYAGFGDAFRGGGWWVFDGEKALQRSGTWARTLGQIPMWVHYGEPSRGTKERPALSRLSCMMLNQIAVALMNVVSQRDYDYMDACASRLFFLNADGELMTVVGGQKANVWVGVPSQTVGDGAGGTKELPVQLYDGSQGAVAAEVSQLIVDAKVAEAREEAMAQATSVPDSSGASKAAGYREQKSPLLARRAWLRQQSEQTHVYFAELRNGTGAPTGSVVWPTEFDIAPLVDAIDANLDRLRRSGLQSPTLTRHLLVLGADNDGVMPEDAAEREAVEAELTASAQGAARAAVRGRLQAAADAALLTGEGDGEDGDGGPQDDGGAPPPPAP